MEKKEKKQKMVGLGELADYYFESQREAKNIEEVLEREVKKFGNSGHIPIPSKHIGRMAKVIIKKKEEEK